MLLGVWPERAILVKHLSDFSPHFALSGTDRPEGKFMWIADLWGLSGEWRIKQIELSPFEDFWGLEIRGASKGETLLSHWPDLTNGLSSAAFYFRISRLFIFLHFSLFLPFCIFLSFYFFAFLLQLKESLISGAGPWKLRWGLLVDRYGLPIRDYWQTVRSANKRLLADRSQNI